jgi:probable HAF family extracellular repeat protein
VPRSLLVGSPLADEKAMRLRYRVVALGPPQIGVDVNALGEVVGQRLLTVDDGTRAVLLREGTLSDLGTLGGTFSTARGINNGGLIVGGSLTANDESHHGFLYAAGRMCDLNSLLVGGDAWEVLDAYGINERNDIVALASSETGDQTVLLVAITPASEGDA